MYEPQYDGAEFDDLYNNRFMDEDYPFDSYRDERDQMNEEEAERIEREADQAQEDEVKDERS